MSGSIESNSFFQGTEVEKNPSQWRHRTLKQRIRENYTNMRSTTCEINIWCGPVSSQNHINVAVLDVNSDYYSFLSLEGSPATFLLHESEFEVRRVVVDLNGRNGERIGSQHYY